MRIGINYEELFFGKFNVTEEEKRKTALYLAIKAFSEAMEERGGSADLNGGGIELSGAGLSAETDEERTFERIRLLLAREFFVFAEKDGEKPVSEVKPTLGAAERYIRQNYMYASLSAEEIAERAGIPRGALDKLFKEKYSATVAEYLKRMRVEKAKVMIDGGVALKDCASECGFGSEKTMKRAFVEMTEMTPCAYRAARVDSKKSQ